MSSAEASPPAAQATPAAPAVFYKKVPGKRKPGKKEAVGKRSKGLQGPSRDNEEVQGAKEAHVGAAGEWAAECARSRIALTWGDAGENHVGMQVLGSLQPAGTGFTLADLHDIQKVSQDVGIETQLVDFGRGASVLVVRQLVREAAVGAIRDELCACTWDAKYYDVRRKVVLNKQARTNLMFQHGWSQEPDYEQGKGTVVDLDTLPSLCAAETAVFSHMRRGLNITAGAPPADDASVADDAPALGPAHAAAAATAWVPLICEGNRYFDAAKCGIGFHGDTERTRVICLSVGGSAYPMRWQWFHRNKAVGAAFDVELDSGDVYIMSEKAVGQDWKRSSLFTLRHAAGAAKYRAIRASWK